MQRLTKRQEEIYSYLLSTFITSSHIPTLSEIARHFDFNKRAAFDAVDSIMRKGYLEKSEDGIILLSKEDRENLINGRIPSKNSSEQYSYIPLKYIDGISCFTMIIATDEMKNIGILPGDTGVFARCTEADNGDIILCSLEEKEDLMLRRLFIRQNGLFDLIPENDTMGRITANRITIHARLIMSGRRYCG